MRGWREARGGSLIRACSPNDPPETKLSDLCLIRPVKHQRGHDVIRIDLMICVWGATALACAAEPEPELNVTQSALMTARQPFFEMGQQTQARLSAGSLFISRAEGGLFAALPARLDAPLRGGGTKAARLRDLIASAEAGRAGYDAVQYGARVKPPKPPTQMTLAEIYQWIDDTPGQPHAIGRYQFIPPTLRHSAKRLGLPLHTRFSPETQDKLADLLLGDAGFLKVQRGEISPDSFIHNLARIWAGLPTASGRSYYHGVAGNKAVISYDSYALQVRAILGV
jgi:hypothetical protein